MSDDLTDTLSVVSDGQVCYRKKKLVKMAQGSPDLNVANINTSQTSKMVLAHKWCNGVQYAHYPLKLKGLALKIDTERAIERIGGKEFLFMIEYNINVKDLKQDVADELRRTSAEVASLQLQLFRKTSSIKARTDQTNRSGITELVQVYNISAQKILQQNLLISLNSSIIYFTNF